MFSVRNSETYKCRYFISDSLTLTNMKIKLSINLSQLSGNIGCYKLCLGNYNICVLWFKDETLTKYYQPLWFLLPTHVEIQRIIIPVVS